MRIMTCFACLTLLVFTFTACDGSSSSDSKPRVAFITNGVGSFWVIAQKGAIAAGKDNDVNASVYMPVGGVVAQKKVLEDLLAKQIDGIAISPIEPGSQIALLNKVAERTHLITHDSDAAASNRLVYIGMDNYLAGRMCADLIKKAIPEGGEICLFVGRVVADNGRKRRQGVIDGLLGRSNDPTRFDKLGTPLIGDKYTILETFIDGNDAAVAKAKAEDAILKYPNLACMVGLFAHNSPGCVNALKQANKLKKIQLVGFDEDDQTLRGIQQGNVYGTVVQDPYMYGYKSVEILSALIKGDKSMIPDSKFIDIPARVILKKDVDAFWEDLKKKSAGAE